MAHPSKPLKTSVPTAVTALVLSLSSCPALEVIFPGKSWQAPPAGARVIPPAKVDEALRYLQSVVGREGNTGTLIVQDGYLLYAGENTRRPFAIWSCTKSFMSTCLGLLWDDGKCTPDDLACKYLPELAKDYPTVTLGQLATFTSGAHVDFPSIDAGPPDYAPGTRIHYSAQSDLLAYILTRIAGEPLRELFRRRIADPIGMDPSGWEWKSTHTRDGIVVNGGSGLPESGMHMTAENLARFGWLFANHGNWNGRQLISTKYIDYATRPHVPATMPMHDPQAWYKHLPGTYGLNWWTNGILSTGTRLWPSAPASTFAAQGNNNNICIIVPEWKLVLVRTSNDQIIDVGLFDGALKILHEGLADESKN